VNSWAKQDAPRGVNRLGKPGDLLVSARPDSRVVDAHGEPVVVVHRSARQRIWQARGHIRHPQQGYQWCEVGQSMQIVLGSLV